MFRSVFYLLLILLMPFRLWADETSEEIATINKRIEILSQELARYSKVKTYREIETELGQLEHQIATASGENRKALEAKLAQTHKEYEDSIIAFHTIETDKTKQRLWQERLNKLKSGSTEKDSTLSPEIQVGQDVRLIGTACEAYIVHHSLAPKAATYIELLDQLQPIYIKNALVIKDPWGRPLVYHTDISGLRYWIISYGADGKPDQGIYDQKGLPLENAAGKTTGPNDDVIFSEGGIIRGRESDLSSVATAQNSKLNMDDNCAVLSDEVATVIIEAERPKPTMASSKLKDGCHFSNNRIQTLSIMFIRPKSPLNFFNQTFKQTNAESISDFGEKTAYSKQNGLFMVLNEKIVLLVSYDALIENPDSSDKQRLEMLVRRILKRL